MNLKLVKRLVSMAVVAVIIVAAGVVSFLAGTDFTRFARRVETALEAATGREIAIKGKIEADFLTFDPEIVLNDVRVASGAGSRAGEMARIKRIHVELRLLPLLSGRLRIERLVLDAPVIRIETDSTGRGNWPVAARADKARFAGMARLQIKSLRMEDGRITYRANGASKDTEIRLNRLTISADDAVSPLRLATTGSLDGRWFRLTMQARSAATLVGGKDTAVRFDALSEAGDLSGRLTVRLGDPVSVTGSLASSRIDLRTPGAGAGNPWSLSETVSLPLRLLRTTSAVLSVRVARVRLDAFDLAQVRASVSLQGAVMTAQPISARLAQGRLTGTFRLDAATEPAQLAVKLNLTGTNLTELGKLVVRSRRMTGRLEASLAASAKGKTIAAIASGLSRAPLVVTIKNLSLANTPWGSRPDMARIKSLDLSLDVPALLAGRLHVNHLIAVGPNVHLETDKSGRRNWTFAIAGLPGSKGAPVFPTIDKIRIDGARVVYRDHAGKRSYRIRLDRFSALGTRGKAHRFEAAGSVDGKRIGIKGTVGTLATLAAGQPSRLTFAAKLGKSDLSGKLNVRLDKGFQARGTLASDRLDLGDPTPEGRPGTMLLSEDPIPVGLLRSGSGRVSYRAKTLLMGLMKVSGLSASATLANGRLTVSRVTGTIAKGKLTGRAILDGRAAPPRIDLAIDVDRAVLADALGARPARVRPDELLDFSVRVTGRGRSLRALAATLDGSSVLVLGSGRVAETAGVFKDLGSGMLKAVTTLARIRGGPIRCAAFRARFRNGMGRTEIMVVDTERTTFVGRGTVNLRTQTMDAIFYPRSKIPLLRRVKLYAVRFQGPIQDPKTKIDVGAAAAKSASAIVGLLKLPIDLAGSLFGGKSRIVPRFDPCPSAIAKATGVAPGSRPDRRRE